MDGNTQAAQLDGTATDGGGAIADDGPFVPITSQEQFDAMVKDRVARAKRNAIPADYDEVKAKAARLDEMEAQNKTELEKATERADAAVKRAEAAEAEAQELKHAAEISQWKTDTAAATGVPVAVLRGDTLEEIQAHAEAVKASMPVYPHVAEHSGNAQPMSKADIFAIKDSKARKAAILANLQQFS